MSVGPKPPAKSAQPPLPQLSDETVRDLIETQRAKIGLEMKQAEITLRELDHNQKIADKSIEAQIEDRKGERELAYSLNRQKTWLVAGIVAAVLVFVIAAMFMDKDQLALDVFKVLMGAIGGWGARAAAEKPKPQRQDD